MSWSLVVVITVYLLGLLESLKTGNIRNFSPIRIHVDYRTSQKTDQVIFPRLERITNYAVRQISEVISVHPTKRSLLLERETSCVKRWSRGPNMHRCSKIRNNYLGEFCSGNVDAFKIPDEHLTGVDVFSYNNSVPEKESIPSGSGIEEVDFIFYVQSSPTRRCYPQELIAYASVCQLGENDRPIAGFANFCLDHLRSAHFDFAKSVVVMMHELIHVLGFSGTLFPKYKDCQIIGGKLACYTRKNLLIQVTEEISAIALPTALDVVKGIQNCSEKCLELTEALTTDLVSKSSHWRNLPWSIMSKNVGMNNKTFLDDLTLAVLQDSGWYEVNFGVARTFGDLMQIQEPPLLEETSGGSYFDRRHFIIITSVVCLEISMIFLKVLHNY